MDKTIQEQNASKIIIDERISALSWKIATEPNLYHALASNPYSPQAQKIMAERFPEYNSTDIVRAVVLAEPEASYDRNFYILDAVSKAEALNKQNDISIALDKRLIQVCKTHLTEFSRLPKNIIYNSLSILVFETADLKEIEQKYSQKQRADIRCRIVNYIEDISQIISKPVQKADNNSSLVAPTAKKPKRKGGLHKAVFLALLFIIPCFLFILRPFVPHQEASKRVLGINQEEIIKVNPVRLVIPEINVDAAIQFVGLTSEGLMDVPSNIVDVGWFKLGPRPGEKGSAVIAGHYDDKTGETGVFNDLHKLKTGDKLYIKDDGGKFTTFVVRELKTYLPGIAEDVFGKSDIAHLNLITCKGEWDRIKQSYNERLVVLADIAK